MAEGDVYTKDGTVDVNKKPADKTRTGKWKACRPILQNECCERLPYYGMCTNLVNYMIMKLGECLCSALSLTTVARGSYLSSALMTVVQKVTTRKGNPWWVADNLNRSHLDYFYWLLAILSTLNSFLYLWIAKWYNYKKVNSN